MPRLSSTLAIACCAVLAHGAGASVPASGGAPPAAVVASHGRVTTTARGPVTGRRAVTRAVAFALVQRCAPQACDIAGARSVGVAPSPRRFEMPARRALRAHRVVASAPLLSADELPERGIDDLRIVRAPGAPHHVGGSWRPGARGDRAPPTG
ncbi:MAG: hypothetical protein MUF00_14980 [Gemmatimonadaceae bacterium]|jgi:hypothetical protein|nr:hypothetical protein [Gemmatimonadaceae bacterium]